MREQLEAVQRMQDYIEVHLEKDITLAGLARVSLFSPWYSYRLFTQWTGYTPADYVRRLRLSRSALRLRDEKLRVSDAAFELGFGSVDGYQRAFFKEFGCNPKRYAKSPVPIHLFTPYGVLGKNARKEINMENTRNIFIQLIEKPDRKVIIKRGVKADDYWSYCEEVGCDVWGLLKSMKSISGEPVCLWLPLKYRENGTSEYVQGVEADESFDGPVPEGFDVITLPKASYLMFCGEPFAEEDFEQAISEIWNAEKKYDPSVAGYSWDDENPRIQLEPVGTRGYIELLPVKPKN